jgi:hypothetical protein
MLGATRRRLAGISSALTMSLVLGLMLATVVVAKGPVTHSVSAGGADLCRSVFDAKPGCDANFSLTAIQYADGSASGQYTDRFGRLGGFHAVIDCVVVDGPDAWVSGFITSGTFKDPDTGEVFDLTGLDVATRLHDGSPEGSADQISFSLLDQGISCLDRPGFDLFDVTEGQVVVR